MVIGRLLHHLRQQLPPAYVSHRLVSFQTASKKASEGLGTFSQPLLFVFVSRISTVL